MVVVIEDAIAVKRLRIAVLLIVEANYADLYTTIVSYLVFVGLAPDSLGLGLDASDTIEDGNGTVKDTKRTLDFDCEIYVSRATMKSIISDMRTSVFRS